MTLELKPITVKDALKFLRKKNCNVVDKPCDFAISAVSDGKTRGVIVMYANGVECELVHMYTDGTALVGSLLYGGAWRSAKALGYGFVKI